MASVLSLSVNRCSLYSMAMSVLELADPRVDELFGVRLVDELVLDRLLGLACLIVVDFFPHDPHAVLMEREHVYLRDEDDGPLVAFTVSVVVLHVCLVVWFLVGGESCLCEGLVSLGITQIQTNAPCLLRLSVSSCLVLS